MISQDNGQENNYIEEEKLPETVEMNDCPDEVDELSDEEESSETDSLADQLEIEKQKSQELKDTHLRLMAEFDNYRKRTLREKSEMLKSAGENILTALLPVVDDFERALTVIQNSDDIDANRKGVELIYEKLQSFLATQGLKVIDTAAGTDFDTAFSEAVTAIPAKDKSLKGKIVDCIQKGYMLNDRVIRFAKVVVGE
ncbi:MAG: nucleotide exchange factor GrpE [Bacteroidales bacterium]|jgi:molecular chaperone GrpE|nr:nucleotide exchange factor GrpE [Bacteroidales bacterium]